MKKNNAFATLVKDLILAAIAFGIGIMLLQSEATLGIANAGPLGFFAACIPFGWRWSSKIITACSLKGVGIKLLISLALGVVAIFVVLGWNILCCIGQLISNSGAKKHAQRYAEGC